MSPEPHTPHANDHAADVIVVGAGPTGLLLAGDLASRGVRTVVLERRASESNLTRAFAVHARTLEMLDARGVADELVATGAVVPTLRLFGDVELDLSHLASRFPYLLITPQYETERVLAARAERAGARIVRGTEVVGLHQHPDHVTLDVRSGDSTVDTWAAPYVVGTDGVRSAVRTALGLPFPGHSAVQSVMLADVQMTEAPRDLLVVNGVREGFAFVVPFGDGWHRVLAWDREHQLPDDAPVDFDDIRRIVRLAHGTDFGMHDPRFLSRFHSDERQVPQYRVGRVFLAGDAAHVHSPAGGQGMNTGLQDAANLGWKLAAAVHGDASEDLLDSYHAERHPVGRMVLRGSGALLRLALMGSRMLRATRNTVARGMTHIPPVADRIARTVSGIGIDYPAPHGAHALTGKRAPDLPLAADSDDAPKRLYEVLRGGTFVLVTSSAADVAAAAPWGARVVTATPREAEHAAVLVRPDGYVAWASDDAHDADRTTSLREALASWSGPATAPTAGRQNSREA